MEFITGIVFGLLIGLIISHLIQVYNKKKLGEE